MSSYTLEALKSNDWLRLFVSSAGAISALSRFAGSSINGSRKQNTSMFLLVTLPILLNLHSSALIAKRIAEKKEKVAAIKASHKKYVVFLYLTKLMFIISQDRVICGFSALFGLAHVVLDSYGA